MHCEVFHKENLICTINVDFIIEEVSLQII